MKIFAAPLFFSLAVFGSAQATEAGHAKSRTQVATELQEAKASGQYTFGELDYPAVTPQSSYLTEQEVRAQLQKAKSNGEYTFGELEYPPVAR
ncbi:DUF4148 domain-containing protein [Achromobacter sp. SLBN-14]|uniref:DUF4148 domain-containing protein n=1 Tax=Achromobacter sp. SLBN-14 TaxID=2768442 RepID=UPI00114DDE3D|nr:DUF4148 domain-containing protein [Achromobacter sp. SLBN-14]TQJ96191.1 uncharacterized protein DUF4148 [Achromobacter sp. SLBN-14]